MYKKVDNYKIMVPFSYLIVHMIIWCSAWSTYILPDREFASEGLIVMNMIFVCAGFCAPYMWAGIAHCVLIADILVANCFIHYDNLVMILLFNEPCVFAVWAMHRIMEKSNNPICSITVSIGVAGYESGSYHTVIEAADKALYRAKKEGRNRVIIYENSERKE